MEEIRNANGKLVASVNVATQTVIIVLRGCITRIHFTSDGKYEVINIKM